MCKTPCLGTPEDIMKLMEAGFSDRLAPTLWAVGVLYGTHKEPVKMMQPILDEETGYCTFFKDGLCTLHDLGLKPTEGAMAHCSQKGSITRIEYLHETPLYKVVKEWENLKI